MSSTSEKFWSKVDIPAFDDCWPWQGHCDRHGYGSFKQGEKLTGSHRVAWELTRGPIPEGLHVCHHCDNPPCCNPSHLFLGTHQDNMRDMVAKGRDRASKNRESRGTPPPKQRAPRPPGRSGRAKLTEKQVQDIRALYATGEYTQDELGVMFGVARSRISETCNRKTWRLIP